MSDAGEEQLSDASEEQLEELDEFDDINYKAKVSLGYSDHNHIEEIQARLRYTFFRVLSRTAYEAVAELQGAPKKLYVRLESWDPTYGDYSEASKTLHQQLQAWQDKYNLTEDWCLNYIYTAFEVWCRIDYYDDSDWGDLHIPNTPELEGYKNQFRFECVEDLRNKTRSKIEKEIRSAFENSLNDFLDKQETILKENGFITAKKKSVAHLEWLVRYQVQGWSREQIAAFYNQERTTIRDGIKDVADRIGLTLRK